MTMKVRHLVMMAILIGLVVVPGFVAVHWMRHSESKKRHGGMGLRSGSMMQMQGMMQQMPG
jgi:hypothetical protein